MQDWPGPRRFTRAEFEGEASRILELLKACPDLATARSKLFAAVSDYQFDLSTEDQRLPALERVIARDCARALRCMLMETSEAKTGFSVLQALWDVAHGVDRPDLEPGFFAEMIHLVQGVEGRPAYDTPGDMAIDPELTGREAAVARSAQLDLLWGRVSGAMDRHADGLAHDAVARRASRRRAILAALDAEEEDWSDWRWQTRHVVKDGATLQRLVRLSESEGAAVAAARSARLPFGVTPYYLSLMDDDPDARRDTAVRAQVLPPMEYVQEMAAHRGDRECAFDFMLERDTSPIDLITRRYPAIVILKPFNTCPQICVYCQRNWEIDDAMAPHAMAPWEKVEAACQWIEQHPAIREVLLTGGDPLTLTDSVLERILSRVAAIPTIDAIRIGSRIPVTMPMRVTEDLATLIASYREPGRREVCVVTHVEQVYEITPELVRAVDRLRRRGVTVFNQHVFTFYVSRRFEAAKLRMLLWRSGIEPYYQFVPKGKQETRPYRVPLARILQEQKEEARLLPGIRRTDEAVYNVPGLGKNYLRASQHRDLLAVLPDGARVYEFHPWEKKIARTSEYVGSDVPILEYLKRLAAQGEDPEQYASIWYYF
jgi:lysine 2,3-aminomutase